MKGTLYLAPMLLGESDPDLVIPKQVREIILSMKYFFVENIRTTRRYLRLLDRTFDIDNSIFVELSKSTSTKVAEEMLQSLLKGNDGVIISEAGLPCIGDPGRVLVEMAHKRNIKVVPLSGPSSFVLTLIASGFNGQNFAFNGYLPIKNLAKQKAIKDLESRSVKFHQTQIFMETPYRNNNMFQQILLTCSDQTKLCVAMNVTLKDEYISTKTIKEWRNVKIDLHKKPTVFAIYKY